MIKLIRKEAFRYKKKQARRKIEQYKVISSFFSFFFALQRTIKRLCWRRMSEREQSGGSLPDNCFLNENCSTISLRSHLDWRIKQWIENNGNECSFDMLIKDYLMPLFFSPKFGGNFSSNHFLTTLTISSFSLSHKEENFSAPSCHIKLSSREITAFFA